MVILKYALLQQGKGIYIGDFDVKNGNSNRYILRFLDLKEVSHSFHIPKAFLYSSVICSSVYFWLRASESSFQSQLISIVVFSFPTVTQIHEKVKVNEKNKQCGSQ